VRRTSILVDPHILTELDQLALAQGRPTAHLIREAMERYAADE
jgi:predicted DNA-binding protein